MKKNKDLEVVNQFDAKELDQAIDQQLEQTESSKKRLRISELKKSFSETKLFNFTKGKVWPILLPFFVVMIVLIILPLISIVVYAIVQPTGNSIMFKISLENFIKFFTTSNIFVAMMLSIAYAVVSSIICVVVGYPIALMMANTRSKILTRNMWVLVTMPIWISMLLKVLGLQSFFYLVSPTTIGTPIAIIVGMVYMFLPFAITPIYNALESRTLDLEEAAKDLGMSSHKTFWSITFRGSIPGVITGFTLVIVQAATSLIVVHYLGDGKINLIASVIESYFFKGNNFGFGAAISAVLTVLIFLVIVIGRVISNRFEFKGGKKKWRNSSRVAISQ
ncbi:spermidine/putrescine ABC transporter permease [Williamsoniiplasma lucivorax]|uniref:Spermidine/putrescine ABC transporter permease n=1 Tax=Williamsoniiplasma lucivorax TaxID=209274 RepID=A0A2S5R9V9_9MOLU|nr:spermidine/putrescine ABC transporter permease [Williamsoniiplasma lucivorax]PPE04114.1 spermidine/putrescine ABC transporter permease [Williamsoniiplasma lucivorax]